MVYELFKIMKVKTGKVKALDQTTVRSILFGKENKEEEIIKVKQENKTIIYKLHIIYINFNFK